MLARDEGRTTRCTTLFRVIVRKDRALICGAIKIRRPVAKHSAVIGTDIAHANIVAPNHQNIRAGFVRREARRRERTYD
jgi:hypothetical protein